MVKRSLVRAGAAALLMAGTAAGAGAQARPEQAVRAVADSFFNAVKREHWDTAATFLDMKAFETFFRGRVAAARAELPSPGRSMPTVEQLMARDSTLPRAVAEWRVAQMTKSFAGTPFGDYSSEFAGVRTQQALFALKPKDAAARWLAASDNRTALRELWQRKGCRAPDSAAEAMAPRLRVVAVAATRDTAYVVFSDDRFTAGDDVLFSSERVMRLTRVANAWRIVPRRELINPDNIAFDIEGCPGGDRR